MLAAMAAAMAACTEPVELEWKYPIGAGSVSTPLVGDGFIAFGHERGLTIIEKGGTPRCTFDAHGEVISRPATDGKLVFFGSTNYIFYAVDPRCQLAWKFATRDRIKSDPAVTKERVYLSSYDGHVYALHTGDGHELWSFPGEAQAAAAGEGESPEPVKVGDFSYSSPMLADGVLYIGNLDRYLYALDAETGAMRWRYRTKGAVTSTPLVADGVVYFGSNDGYLYAIEPGAAKVRWRYPTHDWVNSSAVLVDGVIYVGSNDRHLYALDAKSGRLLWKFTTQGPVVARPVVFHNLVFAAGGSGDGAVYAVQRTDGSLFWKYRTGGKVDADPVLLGSRLFVTSMDQNLYAFDIRATTKK